MPLVVLSGQPCSGKSRVAAKLADSFRALGHEVSIVDEPSLHLIRNNSYKDAVSEKHTRGKLKSAVERALAHKQIVILDSLNNIKGYRYEIWCAARFATAKYCMVHVDTPVEQCRAWNRQREGDTYSDAVFEDLAGRFERPDPRNRWDAPLFTLQPAADLEAPQPSGVRGGPAPSPSAPPAAPFASPGLQARGPGQAGIAPADLAPAPAAVPDSGTGPGPGPGSGLGSGSGPTSGTAAVAPRKAGSAWVKGARKAAGPAQGGGLPGGGAAGPGPTSALAAAPVGPQRAGQGVPSASGAGPVSEPGAGVPASSDGQVLLGRDLAGTGAEQGQGQGLGMMLDERWAESSADAAGFGGPETTGPGLVGPPPMDEVDEGHGEQRVMQAIVQLIADGPAPAVTARASPAVHGGTGHDLDSEQAVDLAAAVAKGLNVHSQLTPTFATSSTPLLATNTLHDIDQAAQAVIDTISDAQAAMAGGAAGRVRFGEGLPVLQLDQPVNLAELRRHKRAFLKLATKIMFARLQDGQTARRMFIDYLRQNVGGASAAPLT